MVHEQANEQVKGGRKESLCAPWTELLPWSLLNALPQSVIACDLQGGIQFLNPAAVQLVSKGGRETSHEAQRLLDAVVQQCIERFGAGGVDGQQMLFRPSPGGRPLALMANLVRNADHEPIGFVFTFFEDRRSQRLIRELAFLASHDELTHLVNLREFRTRLQRVVADRRIGREDALLYMDLDHFKTVNDLCGHAAGDEALRQIAALLKAGCRQRDTLARVGGDELCLLMEFCPFTRALEAAREIVTAVERYVFVWKNRSFKLGISVGLVALSGRHREVDVAMSAADAACYQAKRTGGHQVVVCGAFTEP